MADIRAIHPAVFGILIILLLLVDRTIEDFIESILFLLPLNAYGICSAPLYGDQIHASIRSGVLTQAWPTTAGRQIHPIFPVRFLDRETAGTQRAATEAASDWRPITSFVLPMIKTPISPHPLDRARISPARMSAFLIAILVGTLSAVPAQAHHSFAAMYDGTKPVRLEGVLSKIEWTNPHSYIYVVVKNPDGTSTEWAGEAAGPGALSRRGFKKGSIKIGDTIIIDGFLAKSGAKIVDARRVTLPDGTVVNGGTAGDGGPGDPIEAAAAGAASPAPTADAASPAPAAPPAPPANSQ
jgi:uncharacterized protein DUF6152